MSFIGIDNFNFGVDSLNIAKGQLSTIGLVGFQSRYAFGAAQIQSGAFISRSERFDADSFNVCRVDARQNCTVAIDSHIHHIVATAAISRVARLQGIASYGVTNATSKSVIPSSTYQVVDRCRVVISFPGVPGAGGALAIM